MMGLEATPLSCMLYNMQNEEYFNNNKSGTSYKETQIIVSDGYKTKDPEIWDFPSKKLSIKMWRKDTRYTLKDNVWIKYCKNVDGLFFIINSAYDYNESYNLFHETLWYLGKEYRDIPILLFCDRTDLPCALTINELKK